MRCICLQHLTRIITKVVTTLCVQDTLSRTPCPQTIPPSTSAEEFFYLVQDTVSRRSAQIFLVSMDQVRLLPTPSDNTAGLIGATMASAQSRAKLIDSLSHAPIIAAGASVPNRTKSPVSQTLAPIPASALKAPAWVQSQNTATSTTASSVICIPWMLTTAVIPVSCLNLFHSIQVPMVRATSPPWYNYNLRTRPTLHMDADMSKPFSNPFR